MEVMEYEERLFYWCSTIYSSLAYHDDAISDDCVYCNVIGDYIQTMDGHPHTEWCELWQ